MPGFSATQAPSPDIQLMIASHSDPVELDEHHAALPLPQGPDGDAPLLYYGPYLNGLQDLLLQDGCSTLLEVVSNRSGAPVSANDIIRVEIISEKHGALYNVAHVRVFLADRELGFALSSAATDDQKSIMAREAQALREVRAILTEDLVPPLRFEGEARYWDRDDGPKMLRVLITDWLDDFHEFHLCGDRPGRPGRPRSIEVWDGKRGKYVLSRAQAAEVYRKAARLLTLCFDGDSGRQVYPWHHAAGDFVIRCVDDAIEVRLITVRDFRRLILEEAEDQNPVLSLLHFFLNLTLRMRLDRLDGTGDLAWMERPCLQACVSGFLDGCRINHTLSTTFPDPAEILDVLGAFEESDLYDFLQIVAADGLVEPDEAPFLGHHLAEHATELRQTLTSLHA